MTDNDPKDTAMTVATTPSTTLDGERADLLAELANARAFLINTVRGLGDEQIGQRPTASALCLGGLVKHVASVEESWLRFAVEGASAMSFALPDGVTWDDLMAGTAREMPQWAIDRENEFAVQPGETLAGILERYERVAVRTREVVASVEDLSATHPLPEAPWSEPGAAHSVRRVLMHVIAETAQHAGHADILRETIDGQTST
ncbi:DinB family protein [Streptomonospora wellingtoniae]|uniref:DinB family protein n=1 Tax=Streptomonospora wellingtoniae TaxID=3075544 RepID=A0ABU2L138_9ACTN|nr:DinB family protein [Streptomonospora sp. DSM 45055]MDT0304973.1 DinB family protein [Streptomonospora sp. DSM 45055]